MMAAVIKTLDEFITTDRKNIDPLEIAVNEYILLQIEMKRLKYEMEQKRKEIINLMGNKTEAIVGDKKVVLKDESRTYLKTRDVKKFLEAHGILEDFIEVKKVRKLIVI